MVGATIGKEFFKDLDYSDPISRLSEMVEDSLLSFEVISRVAKTFDLDINQEPKQEATSI